MKLKLACHKTMTTGEPAYHHPSEPPLSDPFSKPLPSQPLSKELISKIAQLAGSSAEISSPSRLSRSIVIETEDILSRSTEDEIFELLQDKGFDASFKSNSKPCKY